MRITWQTVRRNTNEILRVKGFTLKLVSMSWAWPTLSHGFATSHILWGGCGLEDFFLGGGGHLVFRGNGGEREESTATEYKRRTIENWINNTWLLIFSNFLRIWVMSRGLSNMIGDSLIPTYIMGGKCIENELMFPLPAPFPLWMKAAQNIPREWLMVGREGLHGHVTLFPPPTHPFSHNSLVKGKHY